MIPADPPSEPLSAAVRDALADVAQQPARWVDTAPALAELVAELRDAPRYGFDTEFIREGKAPPRAALIQICWDGGLAVVDPLAVDLAPLAPVFHGPGVAVGHALAQDLEILEVHFGAGAQHVFDTQIAASFLGERQIGLAPLLSSYLGVHLTKGPRRSNWLFRPLSAAQRSYAADDVRFLMPLVDHLEAQLNACGRLAWAQEDSERLRVEGISRPGPADGITPDELAATVRAHAASLGLPGPLLATRADLAWWMAGAPPDRLTSGWRVEVLGPLLDDFAASLAADPGRG